MSEDQCKIEMTAEEVGHLQKRAELIGNKKMEIAIMEREAGYKMLEIVASHKGDPSSVWLWQGNFLVKKKEEVSGG